MTSAGFSWLLNMAWRDSRRNRGKLLLFISSILLGIAALVAINSFSANLQKDIQRESKSLLGADLILEANQPAPPVVEGIMDTLDGERAAARFFISMALFPKSNDTRLVQVRALEGDFPFYGTIVSQPKSAAKAFQKNKTALVDKTLMMQFALVPGDSVKIGDQTFMIEGQLDGAPGQAGITSSIAPTVFIPMSEIESTNLIQQGSRVFYQYYFKLPNTDIPVLTESLDSTLRANTYRYETVESRQRNLRQAFGTMADFLNLVAFIALLLGCIGVASAVHIYVRDKIPTVAVLRCLGASGRQAFLIFLIQIFIFSLLGSVAGALLGSGLQVILPEILGSFLPVQNVSTDISWLAVGQGIITGLVISVLFALVPLLGIRKASPLRTLRASFEKSESKFDIWRWLVYLAIILFIVGFSFMQTGSLVQAVLFPVGIGIALLALTGVAKAVVWAVRRFFPSQWSFVWRQGIANLYRPNNQTLTLIVSIGLGAALISTLFFVQDLLLKQVELTGSGDKPNMILFDIQPSQKDSVASLTKSFDLPIMQQVPIVTMRLDNIDGLDKSGYLQDTTSRTKEWVYNREYRATYRDTLIDSETVIDGEWIGDRAPPGEPVPISLEKNYAEDMDAKIGTQVTFNVQGALVETYVSSIREVDWQKVQTNFFVVFPPGVLERAPQFNVIVSRVESPEQSASFQQGLVKSFPNVSVIDLGQILKSVDDILSKVSFVIRFMALFSILTGIMVLISSIVLSKYQRIKESVLLRTIGASKKQIQQINVLEYGVLGGIATFIGIGLAMIASWILAVFVFDVPFVPDWIPPILVFAIITGLIIIIGLLNNREVVNRPPLEVLRAEG